MGFAVRHPVSIVVAAVALFATGGVFVFARPEYHPRYESKMIDFSKQHYYSPARVRAAFAADGVRLRVSSRFSALVIMSDGAAPTQADALQVVIGPRTGTGSFGPKLEPYDERFGNVMVTYGGKDERLLEHVKAATADLH